MLNFNRKHFFVLLALFCLLGACEKKNESFQEKTIQFGDISKTSENGAPLSSKDPDDWNLYDEWDNQIFALFDDERRNLCLDIEGHNGNSAVPNPAKNKVSLSWAFKDTLDVKLRIVDRNYNLLKSIDVANEELNRHYLGDKWQTSFNELTLYDLDALNLIDTVRAYYKLVGNECEFRGHGDIALIE